MSIEHRYNDKLKVDQYKARYRWRDATGKIRCSKTGWFNSINEASRQASQLKKLKESDAQLKLSNKRSTYLYILFNNFITDQSEVAAREDLGRHTTAFSIVYMGKAIIAKYLPEEVKYAKINEITPFIFRQWVNHINKSTLCGSTIAKYVQVLQKFNHWLADNGYYTDANLELNIELAINRTKLKPISQGARSTHLLSPDELALILKYYREQGLGNFRNFYYYTLFYTLAYTGLRPEEMIALQWKHIDLRPEERIINVVNSISQQEKASNAIARTKKGIYYLKNECSRRSIPIFDIIYQLLRDYKESYKYESCKENIDNCFVFPREVRGHKFDFDMFQDQAYWLKEYKVALKACGLPNNTTIQYLRHYCATFLVAPAPDGLGMDEDSVYMFFGHHDSKMIKRIYGVLETQQKTQKMKYTFKDYYTPAPNQESEEKVKAQERIIKRFKGDNAAQTQYMKERRILEQVNEVILTDRKEYYYKKDDIDIIEKIRSKYNIKFILKED